MYHDQNHNKILRKLIKKSKQVTRINTHIFHQILLCKNIIKTSRKLSRTHGNLFGIFAQNFDMQEV
jgi:hypothetical protein